MNPFSKRIHRGIFPFVVLLICALVSVCSAQMPNPPGQVKPGEHAKNEAYLFAHIMSGDYGRLYYSVSLDGLHWKLLNGGHRVFEDYHGHPDICLGPDHRYYLVGNRGDDKPDINFWVSDDLITWQKFSDYTPDLKSIPNYPGVMMRIGAPKLFFDDTSQQFVLTWHTTHDMGKTDLPEPYWVGQRTIYATSKDLKTFDAPPRRLFEGDTATIDTSIRKDGNKYYAIFKDERYPTLNYPDGKTIRIRSSDHLLGPYTDTSPPISPSFREAPTVIPSPDGNAWYLYYEQYPGVSYGVSVAAHLSGPWYQLSGNTSVPDWNKFEMTPRARHGSMRVISRKEYDALVAHFGP
jgi:hypothetical protein